MSTDDVRVHSVGLNWYGWDRRESGTPVPPRYECGPTFPRTLVSGTVTVVAPPSTPPPPTTTLTSLVGHSRTSPVVPLFPLVVSLPTSLGPHQSPRVYSRKVLH